MVNKIFFSLGVDFSGGCFAESLAKGWNQKRHAHSEAKKEKLLKSLESVVTEIARVLNSIEGYLPKAGSLERLLIPQEVAEMLRVQVETLETWRSRNVGPAFVKLGRREIRYRPSDVLRWLDERVCQSTWEHQQREALRSQGV